MIFKGGNNMGLKNDKVIYKNNSSDRSKILKIDKRLPQIIVPDNKLPMFIDWWNSDIRFEKSKSSKSNNSCNVRNLTHVSVIL